MNQENQRMAVGISLVRTTAMTRLEYNQYRGWVLPEDENGEDEGFMIESFGTGQTNHPDHTGYIQWVPSAVFERSFIQPVGDFYSGLDHRRERFLESIADRLDELTEYVDPEKTARERAEARKLMITNDRFADSMPDVMPTPLIAEQTDPSFNPSQVLSRALRCPAGVKVIDIKDSLEQLSTLRKPVEDYAIESVSLSSIVDGKIIPPSENLLDIYTSRIPVEGWVEVTAGGVHRWEHPKLQELIEQYSGAVVLGDEGQPNRVIGPIIEWSFFSEPGLGVSAMPSYAQEVKDDPTTPKCSDLPKGGKDND